jgi:16S rRNA (guanine1207-N2)-methyltransferase
MFSFEVLRRSPDVEADNLHASDGADRLILDTAAAELTAAASGDIVVIGDRYGALTLGAAALHGARGLRVHQDQLTGEIALARNASALELTGVYESRPLDAELVAGAQVVLLQLPRSLDALAEIVELISEHADADVTVFAGGMIKHLTLAMNDIFRSRFDDVRPGLARQKARVLTVSTLGRRPAMPTGARLTVTPNTLAAADDWPHREFHADLGLWVCAHGAAFAGTKVDIGTRFLLDFLDQANSAAVSALDLGCGTGIIAASLARARPHVSVIATDQSFAAVASAQATMQANGLADRVTVVRDNGAAGLPDASVDLVMLNPPFHLGSSVHSGAALALFADAARVLRSGGELWTVWNSHLAYAGPLKRIVGQTRQVGRNSKFTVTVSVRP